MRLLLTLVLLTTVRLSVGKKLRLRSPATTGRLASPRTTIWRLAAPPNWLDPGGRFVLEKSLCPCT